MLSLSPVARMWSLLTTVGVLIFLLNIDYTAVNLTLVPIASETKSDLNTLQWLLSAYVLTWAALVVPGGRFADLKGKVKTLNFGIIIFMLGSALTGIGHTAWALIAGRILQGLGAALFSAPAYGLIFSSTPPEKQGLAMGFIGALAGLGLAAGPTLAGWIIDSIGWRWIFYINIPLGLLVIFALKLFAEKDYAQENAVRINYRSSSFLILGMALFFFALNQFEVWGLEDPRLWGLATAGLGMLAYFWRYDKRQKNSTIPKSFLKNKAFMGTIWSILISAYVFSMSLVLIALYLQNTLKLSAAEAGYTFLAMTLALGVLSPIGGKLADKMDIRIPINVGFGFGILSCILMMFWQSHTSLAFVIIGLLMAGIGLGVSFPSINTAMFRTLPSAEINSGSALFTMAMMIGNTLSVIINTSLLVFVARPFLLKSIRDQGLIFTPEQTQQLLDLTGKIDHGVSQFNLFSADLKMTAMILVDEAFLVGFRTCMGLGVLLLATGILIIQARLKNSVSSTSVGVMPAHI
jgi:EmrB/QacA subfamily drug resistance transporter